MERARRRFGDPEPWRWGSVAAAAGGAVSLILSLAAGLGAARRRRLTRSRARARRLAEAQTRLMRLSRLNALGELAGSLAHEVNQPLSAVANYLEAARLAVADGSGAQALALIDKAARQADRAREIVARARARVSDEDIHARPESLSDLVREAVDMTLAGLPAGAVGVRYAFDDSADVVVADRLQAQQVVVNLVRNALEAMEAGARRELAVASRGSGPRVEIEIADSGPGVPAALAGQLFTPFATGKTDGMGLGLAISRRIVEAHGGRLWLAGTGPNGATFRFTLPRPAAPQAD